MSNTYPKKNVTFYAYDEEGLFGEQTSQREYVEANDSLEFNIEVGDYYTHTERRVANLYLDPATGLVVFDVEAYEKWMNRA